MTLLRLLFRQYRFEVLAVIVGSILVTVLGVIVRARLLDVAPSVACYRAHYGGPGVSGCPDMTEYLRRDNDEVGLYMGVTTVFPLLAAVLLGSILVSREIENRTAQFAWALRPGRIRWFIERAIPLLLLLTLCLLPIAFIADRIEDLRPPLVAADATFGDYGRRGLPLVARALAAGCLAVAIGSLIGRQLPALIVGTVAALGLGVALGLGFPFGEPSTPTPLISYDEMRSGIDAYFGQGWLTRTGAIVTEEVALAEAPSAELSTADSTFKWLDAHFTEVNVVIDGSHVGVVAARESALLAVISIAGLIGAGLVVRRRPPY